jgi:hypothetical protein
VKWGFSRLPVSAPETPLPLARRTARRDLHCCLSGGEGIRGLNPERVMRVRTRSRRRVVDARCQARRRYRSSCRLGSCRRQRGEKSAIGGTSWDAADAVCGRTGITAR